MAPDRSVGSPGRPHEAHRVPRNHQTCDPRGDRNAPHGQHGSGQRPAGAAHPRPLGRLRALARAVEEGASVALGGSRAVGRRAADRRTRTRDHRLRLGALLPRRGAVLPGERPREDALQGRALVAVRHAAAGRGVPARLHRRRLHGVEIRGETRAAPPGAAVHHPRRCSRRRAASWA